MAEQQRAKQSSRQPASGLPRHFCMTINLLMGTVHLKQHKKTIQNVVWPDSLTTQRINWNEPMLNIDYDVWCDALAHCIALFHSNSNNKQKRAGDDGLMRTTHLIARDLRSTICSEINDAIVGVDQFFADSEHNFYEIKSIIMHATDINSRINGLRNELSA